jgi:hypothetical protein
MGLSMSLALTNFNLVLGWHQLEASGGHWQLKARAGPFNLKVTPESFQPDIFFQYGVDPSLCIENDAYGFHLFHLFNNDR